MVVLHPKCCNYSYISCINCTLTVQNIFIDPKSMLIYSFQYFLYGDYGPSVSSMWEVGKWQGTWISRIATEHDAVSKTFYIQTMKKYSVMSETVSNFNDSVCDHQAMPSSQWQTIA
jgi:hypothetical protein